MIRNIIVEGIDRIGKDTLISKLEDKFGMQVVHSSKPKELDYFNCDLRKYQESYFSKWFSIIEQFDGFIFNRFHLGEYVYSTLYRNYIPGPYLYEYELKDNIKKDTLLILLYTTDFSIMSDDGESFNFLNKETEQSLFMSAFDNSFLLNKIKIQINIGSDFLSPNKIFLKVYDYINKINNNNKIK